MSYPIHACPICKKCGTKKFSIVRNLGTRIVLRCKMCNEIIEF